MTVNALPAAAVNSEAICDGDPAATFTATSATAVSWLWSANGTGTAQTTTGTTAGNYTVVVTDAQGCESAPATGVLTVNALPAAAVNSEAICDGDPAATFTATSATAVSWLWSANGTGTAQTTTGTTAGNYTVVVTDAQGCESAPATGILTVNALPAAAVNSETICDGDPAATFTATSATAVSWLWSANGTGTAQTTTGTTAGNYTVVVTDAQGCESAPATGILTVNALPAAAVNSETICDGDPAATFTATSATAVSWLWSANGTGTAQTTTGTTAGNYTVVVTDAQGCESAPATGILTVNALPAAAVNSEAICDGDPAATFTATSATAVSWLWSANGTGTAQTTTGTTAGNYTVVVTDAQGCESAPATGILTVNALPAAAVNSETICDGDPAATFTATSATAVSWLWSANGTGTAQTTTGTTAGNYTVVVTDAQGCESAPATGILTVNALPAAAVNSEAICDGDPAATFTATSATAVSWLWSANGTGTAQTTTGTTAGNYTVVVTDAQGCESAPATGILTVNALPAAAVNSETICDGDPAATFTATSATAVSWLWSANGTGTAQTTTGTTAGNYTVVVTDAQGCESAPATGILTVNALPAAAVNSETICDGDPAATFTATSATAVSWLWSANGTGTAQTTTGTTAGNYTVVVTDAQGCESAPATGVLTVNALPTAVLLDTNAVICNGANDGQAIIQISGGLAPYEISWTGSTVSGSIYASSISNFVNISGNQDTIKTFPSGTYDITVTDDIGCISTNLFDINGFILTPPELVITEPNALSATTNINPDLTANGYVYKGINNINNTYLYFHSGPLEWQLARNKALLNGGDLIVPNSAISQAEYNSKFNGSGNGWIGLYQNTSSVLYSPILNLDPTTVLGMTPGFLGNPEEAPTGWEWINQFNPSLPGTPLGYDPLIGVWLDYQNWGNSNIHLNNTEPNDWKFCTNSLCTGTINNIGLEQHAQFVNSGPGEFSWNDHGNGTAFGHYMEIPINETLNGNNVTCFDGNDGKAIVTVVGGNSPFTFTWFEVGLASQIQPNGTSIQIPATDTAYNLTAGTYAVIVSDGNGCAARDTVEITEPDSIPISAGPDTTVCSLQPVTLTASGATTYSWENITNGTVLGAGNPQNVNPPVTSTYVVTGFVTSVSDGVTLCENKDTVIVTVNALPAAAVNSEAICDGDPAATFTATSATAVSWLWSANGTGTAQTTTGATAGNYTVVVTDAQGCESAPATGILTVNALPAAAVNSEAICDGDPAATFTATSATAVSWLWSANGTGTAQTTTGTTAGNYTVVVTDAQGCESAPATGILTVNALPAAAVNSEAICDGDPAATFTATSATAVSWLWSANGTGTAQTTTGTTAGNYTVVVTDAQGCESAPATGILTVNALPAATVNSETICDGDPAATFTATSATAVSWLWSANGTGTAQTTTGTTAGNYTVVVTDAQGCESAPATGILTVNALPAAAVNSEAICDGDPAATFTATSATAVSWLWSANGTGTAQTTTGTTAGNYTVVVTDAQGCESAPATGILTVNALPTAVISDSTNPNCPLDSNGNATVLASGGTPGL